MHLDVLGPVRVLREHRPVELGTPRQRAIVAALALSEGRVLPVDALVERVWGADPPASVMGTLQSYIGGLRRVLEPDRAPRTPATVLVTEHDGYALRIPRAGRDDARLADATGRARELLRAVPDPLRPRADAAAVAGCREAVSLVDDAVGAWRGVPYADLEGHPDAVAERTRLTDLRTAAEELRVVALLALGAHDEVVPELESMTRVHPLHERWWTLYAVALVRTGRQADALAALHRLRSVLDDELGVEPSAPVRELQTAILRQDPGVAWTGDLGDAPPAPVARLAQPARTTSRFRVSPPLPQWELTGREPELARLTTGLDLASSGRPQAAWVTGEAGIGKSRLVHELALDAFARGFTVVTGTCGHVGAPDLWPWRQVVTSIEQQSGAMEPPVDDCFAVGVADDFATWEGLAQGLRRRARTEPLLVIVEDVHEADRPTLVMLQHLVATLQDERLLVVATRRAGAGDDVLLVPLTTVIARRGGVRVDLTGLDRDEARVLIRRATGEPLPDAMAADLCVRTSGNPFFLVELALAGGEVGGSLADVVASRLADLSVETREVLEAASVVDITFDEDLVAFMVETTPDALPARLVSALAAGLVVEADPASRIYAFAHGVVRDVVRDGLPATERNRLHSRVAVVLDERSGLRRVDQRAELVRQWQLAGKDYLGPGWRSILRAAEQATLDASHVEAVRLLQDALELQRHDYATDESERYGLLMLIVDAQRWAGDWRGVARTVDEAVATAERMGDHELAARAAMSTIEGAVWQVRTFGVVHAPNVAALERALARLDADPDDSRSKVGLRARARLALATELYYGGDVDRVDVLVEQAIALADGAAGADGGADDLRLLSIVLPGAFSARWRPDTLDWRRDVAARALRVATELGDVRAQAIAMALRACAALEAGDSVLLRATMPGALELSRRLGLVTVEAVLRAAEVPWLLMVGDDVSARASLAALEELVSGSSIPNLDRAAAATGVLAALWTGDRDLFAAVMDKVTSHGDDDGLPIGHVRSWVMLRVGLPDAARAAFPGSFDLSDRSYTTVVNAALACEIGLGLGETDLARQGYALATPYAGRTASGGSSMAIGPVDAYLAFGAAAVGDVDVARDHADAAVRLATQWGLVRFLAWFEERRREHGI